VHDSVVKKMNEGETVFEAMREIRLPTELAEAEGYGKLTWSIRGIYEGYAGWFDTNPASMYDTPASAVYPEVVWLAGGPGAIARLALDALRRGNPVKTLHLTDMALAANSTHQGTLLVRLKALKSMRQDCQNMIERGWLDSSIQTVQHKLSLRSRNSRFARDTTVAPRPVPGKT
jgi:alkyl sulfatase BDS1-like metallo-beta-lactamase superfamily hydrolase